MRNHMKLAALVALSVGAARLSAQVPELKWGAAPAVFPAGAKMAVLQGDPGKAEQFTVRLDFPAGYTIAPHFHPTDEHITVITGTFLVGMGDKIDAAKMATLSAGGFVTAPAKMNHYARAKGQTVVQISAMGPFQLTYVNPADDPTRKGAVKK
jgi:quercetin dioxygenase-like cupin family protein